MKRSKRGNSYLMAAVLAAALLASCDLANSLAGSGDVSQGGSPVPDNGGGVNTGGGGNSGSGGSAGLTGGAFDLTGGIDSAGRLSFDLSAIFNAGGGAATRSVAGNIPGAASVVNYAEAYSMPVHSPEPDAPMLILDRAVAASATPGATTISVKTLRLNTMGILLLLGHKEDGEPPTLLYSGF
jgi:predicted small secreted protein